MLCSLAFFPTMILQLYIELPWIARFRDGLQQKSEHDSTLATCGSFKNFFKPNFTYILGSVQLRTAWISMNSIRSITSKAWDTALASLLSKCSLQRQAHQTR